MYGIPLIKRVPRESRSRLINTLPLPLTKQTFNRPSTTVCKLCKMADTKLKFSSVQSFVDASFFQKLSTLKLDEFRLDETKKPISATVGIKSVSQREGTAVSLNDASFGPVDPSL